MIEQGVIGYLDKSDLDDWRELQAEMSAMRDPESGWSQKERESLYLRELVRLATFYTSYSLSAAKEYNFSPITGAITEVIAGILWEDEDE